MFRAVDLHVDYLLLATTLEPHPLSDLSVLPALDVAIALSLSSFCHHIHLDGNHSQIPASSLRLSIEHQTDA